MKRSRFTEAQIVGILRDTEAPGGSVAEVARRYGVSDQTICGWRKRYGGMDVSEVKRLRELEAENSRLKKLLAEATLEIDVIRDVLRGK